MATENEKQETGKNLDQDTVANAPSNLKCQVPPTSSEGKDGSSNIPYQQIPINHSELVRQAKEDYNKSIPDLRAIVRNHLELFMISKLDPDETPIGSKTDVEQIMRLNMELFNHTNVQKAISGLEKATKKNYSVLFHIYARCTQRLLNGFVGLNSQTLRELMTNFDSTFDRFIPLAEFEKIVQEAKRQVVPIEVAKDMIKGWFSSGADGKTAPYAQGLAKLVKFILPQRYHYYTIYNENPQEIEDFKDVIRVFEKDLERDDGSFDTMVSNLVDVIQMSSIDENMLNTTIKRLNRLFNEFGYNMSIKKGGAPKQDCLTDENCKNMTYNIFNKEGNCINTRVFNFLTDTAFGLKDDDYTRVAAKIGAIDCKHPAPPAQETPIKPPTPPSPSISPTPPIPPTPQPPVPPTPQPPVPPMPPTPPPKPTPDTSSNLEKFLINQIERAANYAVNLHVKPLSGDPFTTTLYTNIEDIMELILQMLGTAQKEKVPSIQKLLETLSNDMRDIATQIFTNRSELQSGQQQLVIQPIKNSLPEFLVDDIKTDGTITITNPNVKLPSNVNDLIVYNIVVDMIRDSLLVLNQYILTILLSKNLNSEEQKELLNKLKDNFSKTVQELTNLKNALKGNDTTLQPKMDALIANLDTIVNNLNDKAPSAPLAIGEQVGGAEVSKPEPVRMTADTIKNDADAIRELRKKIDSIRGNFRDIERLWKSYEETVKIKQFSTDTDKKIDTNAISAYNFLDKELRVKSIQSVSLNNIETLKDSSIADPENYNAFNTYSSRQQISSSRVTKKNISTTNKQFLYIAYNFTDPSDTGNEATERQAIFTRNRKKFVEYLEQSIKPIISRSNFSSYDVTLELIIYILKKFINTPAVLITDLKELYDINSFVISTRDIVNKSKIIEILEENYKQSGDRLVNIVYSDTNDYEESRDENKKLGESTFYKNFKKDEIYGVINMDSVKNMLSPILTKIKEQIPTDATNGVYTKQELDIINTYLSTPEKTGFTKIQTEVKEATKIIQELMQNLTEYANKYAIVNPIVKQRILEVLQDSDNSKPKITLESNLKQLLSLIDSDITEMKGRIQREKEYMKGGTVKEDLLKNRKSIVSILDDSNTQLNLLDAMVQDFTGTLKKSVGMPGYYSNVMMNPGGFSLFDTLYKKYIESQNDIRKGPYVANMELAEGLKSNKLIPREVLAVSKQDKIIFIAFTFFIRLIALAIVDYLINKERINKLSIALIAYLGLYIGFFLVFLLLVNIDGYKLRIVLNYFNLHGNMSVAFAHPMLVGIFGSIMYLVMKNMNTIGSVTAYSNEDKVRLKYKMQVLTLVAWVFVSIITMFT